MILQGRNLSLRLQGDDVKLLHTELRQLGLIAAKDELDKSVFGPTTEALIKTFQTQHGQRPTGIVDQATATLINNEVDRLPPLESVARLMVRGRITADDGAAAPDITVTAFDKDLRAETTLGSATTDRLGRYQIRYEAAQIRRAEKDSADLIVRAFGSGREILAASDTIFNADADTSIDLQIDLSATRPSEFERHLSAITPLLESVAIAELTADDLSFIEGETGIDSVHVAFLATAHQHALTTKIEPAVFYALFRQGLPSAMAALALQSPEVLKRALTASIDAHIAPSNLRPTIASAVDALKKLVAGQVVRGSGDAAAPARILGSAGLSAEEQTTVLDMWAKRDNDASFWDALSTSPLASKVKPLQATLDLALLTGNNAPLMEALQKRKVSNLQSLATLSADDLKKLIIASPEALASIAAVSSSDGAESDEAKATRLAAGVIGLAQALHPTAYLAAVRQKSTKPLDRDVARVLANAPELELRDGDVSRFLAENPNALQGVADTEQTRTELKRIQRVLRLAPEPTHAQALLEVRMDSAHAISGFSASAFEKEFADKLGGPAEARSYHARAQRVSDTVLAMAGAVQQSFTAVQPSVLPNVLPKLEIASNFPNLTTLFGSQNLCACQDCRSVSSPAAYLVDLLEFINPKHGQKPIARLRLRRPDIEHIELSCDNTNIALPYVDLVNEILEFYVATVRSLRLLRIRRRILRQRNSRLRRNLHWTPPTKSWRTQCFQQYCLLSERW